jgi:DNA-binding FadR family transcriptional regulator
MQLQPVESRRLYRRIAEQLRGLITRGEVPPGARLPPERDLAKRLRVSRPSLREALIALEVEGLLDVRVGSGIYVLPACERRARAALPEAAAGPFEILQARRLVEGECAALAARHATPAQLAGMRAALAQMGRERERRPNPLEGDRLFHLRIAEASGNGALALVVAMLWDQRTGALFKELERHYFEASMVARTLREHRAIVAAIARRDPATARAAMRRHMDATHQRYSREWKEGHH